MQLLFLPLFSLTAPGLLLLCLLGLSFPSTRLNSATVLSFALLGSIYLLSMVGLETVKNYDALDKDTIYYIFYLVSACFSIGGIVGVLLVLFKSIVLHFTPPRFGKLRPVLFANVCLFLVLYLGRHSLIKSVSHRNFVLPSPDGNHQLEVYSYPSLFMSMPGQSGDSPGFVQLQDKSGRVLREAEVEMVSLVESPDWDEHHVSIKFIADWSF